MEELRIERDGSLGLITLNRPDRLNALVPGMLGEYARALREFDADRSVRAIVVTGAGRGFCSGADLSVLAQDPSVLNGYLDGLSMESLPTLAFTLGTPVVTAINGPCAGIGMLLGLCADVRFASATATFTSAFSKLGLVAEYGMAWILPRVIGLGPATEILLSGRTVDAREASELGLVTRTSDDALATAREWALNLADTVSPTSVAAMKQQFLAASHSSLGEAVDASLVAMKASFSGPDLAEAIAAKSAGRPPVFTGGSA
jgi:enoyl-CoA hydratase/carnithine racemase